MSNTTTRHIVLIDDDSDDYAVLNYMFQELRSDVRLSSITETDNIIDRLYKDIPDIIFLDIAMPKRNGVELLQEIYTDPVLKQIPVVVYSGSKNPEEIRKVFSLGAIMYVSKPSSYGEFVHTIKNALSADLRVPHYEVVDSSNVLLHSCQPA